MSTHHRRKTPCVLIGTFNLGSHEPFGYDGPTAAEYRAYAACCAAMIRSGIDPDLHPIRRAAVEGETRPDHHLILGYGYGMCPDGHITRQAFAVYLGSEPMGGHEGWLLRALQSSWELP